MTDADAWIICVGMVCATILILTWRLWALPNK